MAEVPHGPEAAKAPSASPSPTTTPEPPPPAGMSGLGGPRLGQPGVQADLPPGTPALPPVEAYSWLVADMTTGQVIAAKNPHWQLAPASTLKMLFADTVLPKLDKNATHVVDPKELQGLGEGSSAVGVKENLTYKVEDLWNGVFLRSGNDAVHVLCAMNGGVDATVAQMNERAKALHADDTHVVSPDGYDMPGQVSSAYDLALFAREGMKNPDFRGYVSTKDAKFPGKDGTTFAIQNTNQMLSTYPGMIGVKNGYTTNAENTFVGAATRDGRTLMVSIMHVRPGKTYEQTKMLLDWGFAAAGTAKPVGSLVDPGGKPGGTPSGTTASGQTLPGQAAAVPGGAQAVGSSSGDGVSWGLWAGIGVPAVLLGGGGLLFFLRRRGLTRPTVHFEDDILP
ncbi:D-alanyl-D-alanine carboxypeptidase family protein [Yinghuangia seranimata]|uniref:D-alanyl-D-alanine carboxypeptidase family protein n=1 Tax=Yinghuangia seranimata TaxID=408067 RepID=UPI00248C2A2C|nr:D-alanyl-D-alanine carboxypeptidase [Yinghuangia seranimata]MDI2126761.1 D-alanyl-D-alanine carboxypeptidase [Yinghuangia seranimata]